MERSVVIPIVFLDRNGFETSDHISGQPCINVGFFFTEEYHNGLTQSLDYRPCWALIDTGADEAYADPSLVAEYNCPLSAGYPPILINNNVVSSAHTGYLFVASVALALRSEFFVKNLAAEGQPYRVLLGRSFLEKSTLLWNGRGRNYRLELFY